MHNKFIFQWALALMLLFSFASPKAHDFEGVITYTITYLELPEEVQGMESMLPQNTKMYFKDDRLAVEQQVMGGTQRVVVDNSDSSSFILMDMMGQKICIVISKEEMRETAKEVTRPQIRYSKETKNILGYKCKKVIMTQDTSITTMYYTNKLDITRHKDFGYIDGFPLEYETYNGEMKLRMTASSIKEETIDPNFFQIPEGYTQMTMDELTNLMGGK